MTTNPHDGGAAMTSYVPLPGSPWVPDGEWQRRKSDGRAAGRRNPEVARRMLAGERRAVSVRRPYANLIVAGHKTVENRTWATDHRGVIVVHAGQAWEPTGAALAAELGIAGFDTRHVCPGGYLGTVRLVEVHPAAGCCAPWGEQGDGVFHWLLSDPHPFHTPIPGPGRLGLYWAPAELSAREA